MENKERQIVNRAIRNHIRFMTRMEKAFYSAIVLTAIVMSISVVYLQGRNQAIKNQITDLNRKISDEKTELNNAKQAVNELTLIVSKRLPLRQACLLITIVLRV